VNALTSLHAHLAEALQGDSLHQLALLVATFDPFWQEADEETLQMAFEADDGLMQAWLITRQAFPDLYADLVLTQAAGASPTVLQHQIHDGFAARGLPIESLDMLGGGIPLMAYGVCLEEPTLYRDHPELIGLLALFGVVVDLEVDALEIDRLVYVAGAALAEALVGQTDPHWQDVGWWIGRAFGATGNTLVDDTDESLYNMPPLSWSTDDIAFGRELIAEADEVMTAAQRGCAWLQATPAASQQLKAAIRQTQRGLANHTQRQANRPKGQKGSRYVPHLRLGGPELADGSE